MGCDIIVRSFRINKAKARRNKVVLVGIFIICKIIFVDIVVISLVPVVPTIRSVLLICILVWVTLLEELWAQLNLLYLSRGVIVGVGVGLLAWGHKEDPHLL